MVSVMAESPFLQKEAVLTKADQCYFCYCYCWSPILLSGQRRQNQAPKTTTYGKEREKKSKARTASGAESQRGLRAAEAYLRHGLLLPFGLQAHGNTAT